jgi:thiamine transporter ThiT
MENDRFLNQASFNAVCEITSNHFFIVYFPRKARKACSALYFGTLMNGLSFLIHCKIIKKAVLLLFGNNSNKDFRIMLDAQTRLYV